MATKKKTKPSVRIPKAVLDIIHPDVKSPPELADRGLTASHVEALRAIVRRTAVPKQPFSMAKAINELAHADKTRSATRAITSVLADREEAMPDRVVAAWALSRGLSGAKAALLDHLTESDRFVRQEVFKSLGIVGDAEALTRLKRLRAVEVPSVAKQLALSKALIAHRHDLDYEHDLYRTGAVRKPGTDEPMVTLSLSPMRKATARAHRERMLGTTYGIDIGDRAFRLKAGRALWTVYVNQALGDDEQLGGMFDRKWIIALLSRWHIRTDRNEVQYVVLTSPKERSAEIVVARTDGEIMYTGTASKGRDLLRFAMRDVKRPGTAPTNVKGRLTRTGLELDMTVPFGRRQGASEGAPVVV